MRVDREVSPEFEFQECTQEGLRAAASGLSTLVREESLAGRVIRSRDRESGAHTLLMRPPYEDFL